MYDSYQSYNVTSSSLTLSSLKQPLSKALIHLALSWSADSGTMSVCAISTQGKRPERKDDRKSLTETLT